jgi:hypothetical protein
VQTKKLQVSLSTINKAAMPKTQEKDELYKKHKKRMSYYSLLQKV